MIRAAVLSLVLVASPASAEIASRSADGFVLHHQVGMAITPEDVMEAVGDLPQWWDPAHTYTGDAANLSLDLWEGGCWCETMPDGTRFQHARVVSVADDQIVMNAPLGPLHDLATNAVLVFSVTPVPAGWNVNMDFTVEGPGLGAAADGVEAVMEQAFGRFIHQVDYGEPPTDD